MSNNWFNLNHKVVDLSLYFSTVKCSYYGRHTDDTDRVKCPHYLSACMPVTGEVGIV